LPDGLIKDPSERLGWYQRLSAAGSEGEVEALLDELRGWVGELPEEVENLGGLAIVKAGCRRLGMVRCTWLKIRAVFELHPRSTAMGKVKALVEKSPKRFQLVEKDGTWRLDVKFLPEEAQKPIRFIRWVFAQIERG
jgi:transcription-repair coupling factor (superfamily II helicase)